MPHDEPQIDFDRTLDRLLPKTGVSAPEAAQLRKQMKSATTASEKQRVLMSAASRGDRGVIQQTK